MEITIPGYIDEEKSEYINICVMCQEPNNVNSYLCYKKKENTQNCKGSLLHEKCLKNWIENKKTFNLKCLNCNSNEIIIPDNIKNTNQIIENDDLTNVSYVIINQYNWVNNHNHFTCCCFCFCLILALTFALIIMLSRFSNF
jgi:hypothetical protein